MEDITNIVEDRYKKYQQDLETKSKMIAEKINNYNKIDTVISDKFNKDYDSTFIKLDIGGKVFMILVSQILLLKDTLFYNLLKKYAVNNQELPKILFFDRSYEYFDIILTFFDTGKINMTIFNEFERELIQDEFEYYGLNAFIDKDYWENYMPLQWDLAYDFKSCLFANNQSGELTINPFKCSNIGVINKTFYIENFEILFEIKSDNPKTFIGIVNNKFSLANKYQCFCQAHYNSSYIAKKNGTINVGKNVYPNETVEWGSTVKILLRVELSKIGSQQVWFIFPELDKTKGPFKLECDSFRVVACCCDNIPAKFKILSSRYINNN